MNTEKFKDITESIFVTDNVNINAGHYSQTGYSKYNERWKMAVNGKIEFSEVYGIEQAKEHISELRESVYMGEKIRENREFTILKVTTVKEVIAIDTKHDIIQMQQVPVEEFSIETLEAIRGQESFVDADKTLGELIYSVHSLLELELSPNVKSELVKLLNPKASYLQITKI